MKQFKILICSLLIISLNYICPAEEDLIDLVIDVYELTTPKKIENWVWNNIEYEKSPTEAKMPINTYLDKEGDCLDLALLNQKLLGKIEVSSTVICIDYDYKRMGHALCVYEWQGRIWVTDNFIHWKMGKKIKTIEGVSKYYGGKIFKRYVSVAKGDNPIDIIIR